MANELILRNGFTSLIGGTITGSLSTDNLSIHALLEQPLETTVLTITGSNVVGTRELGSLAFSSATYDNYVSWSLAGDTGTPQFITSTNTAYFSGSNGITTVGVAGDILEIKHTNIIPAGVISGSATTTLGYGDSFNVPSVAYDANGHITATNTSTFTLPGSDNTDTHWTSLNIVAASGTAQSNAVSTNGNTYLNHIENNTVRSNHKIIGTGITTVVSDASGNITINSPDTNVNTATATNTFIKGSNSGTAITYDAFLVGEKAAGRLYYGTTNPTNTTRLNWDGHFYGTNLYDNGSRVLTSYNETDTLQSVTTRGKTTTDDITITNLVEHRSDTASYTLRKGTSTTRPTHAPNNTEAIIAVLNDKADATTVLDNLAAEVAAGKTIDHPDYALLASRIAVS